MELFEKVKHGLIVSCQALEEEPLHGPILMAGMARAAALGGAVAIRTNGIQEVEVCGKITGLPVIGIRKRVDERGRLAITPWFGDAKALVSAGAAMVAVDVRSVRPFGDPLSELLPAIRSELHTPVMADCATFEDARRAVDLGADAISTTFGFVKDPLGIAPDFDLLEKVLRLNVPVIAEGGFWEPIQVQKALKMGVWSVVIGSAITRPLEITRRFVQAVQQAGCQIGV